MVFPPAKRGLYEYTCTPGRTEPIHGQTETEVGKTVQPSVPAKKKPADQERVPRRTDGITRDSREPTLSEDNDFPYQSSPSTQLCAAPPLTRPRRFINSQTVLVWPSTLDPTPVSLSSIPETLSSRRPWMPDAFQYSGTSHHHHPRHPVIPSRPYHPPTFTGRPSTYTCNLTLAVGRRKGALPKRKGDRRDSNSTLPFSHGLSLTLYLALFLFIMHVLCYLTPWSHPTRCTDTRILIQRCKFLWQGISSVTVSSCIGSSLRWVLMIQNDGSLFFCWSILYVKVNT